MFNHVMVGVNDLEIAKKFYDAVLGTLGTSPGIMNQGTRYFYRSPTGSFSITKPLNGQPATPANGGTIGFVAKSSDEALAFHEAGVANGGQPVRILLALGRVQPGKCILRISKTQTVIRSAPCTVLQKVETQKGASVLL